MRRPELGADDRPRAGTSFVLVGLCGGCSSRSPPAFESYLSTLNFTATSFPETLSLLLLVAHAYTLRHIDEKREKQRRKERKKVGISQSVSSGLEMFVSRVS